MKITSLYKHAFMLALALSSTNAMAQDADSQKIKLTGSIQSDWLLPENDKAIGANKHDYRGDILGNTYIGVNLDSKYISGAIRLESMENPLPGFENAFDTEPFHGTNLPFFQITGRYKWAELTAGTFYEQFGSGFVLRAYEERTLGIDNSILGGRLVLRPYKGVQLKALSGVQRYHFDWTNSVITGADIELSLDQWFDKMADNGHYLTVGVSAVSKHEGNTQMQYRVINNDATTTTYTLQMPENVGAMDFRMQYQKGGYSILAEYAIKANDPCADNGYIYHPGQAAMLSASYSRSGFSALLQTKRSENMGFRSQRDMNPTVTSCYINHQPAFAYQHTYALASLYPYGTQAGGEWAFQADFTYRFKRRTPLGGRYGTLLRLNASHIRGLDKKLAEPSVLGSLAGTDGYSTSWFGMTDDIYYQDINLTMEKKLSKSWKLTAMYMYQEYNQEIIEGHANNGRIIKSHIGVVETKYDINRRCALRMEAQYLTTRQDQGDWAYGLIELSIQPGWMISFADQYNTGLRGGTDTHYFSGNVVYNIGSNRIQLGYGRVREGVNCNGGVCRKVPASRGLTLSYNYNF